MDSNNVLKEFQQHVAALHLPGIPETPSRGIAAMLGFYENVRADDVDIDADGDMLLYQWGTYNSDDGPRFELDITRQFIRGSGEDDDIWQLHLTYRFAPTESLRALGSGDRWCATPADVQSFREFVFTHPAYLAVNGRSDGNVELDYESAG